MLFMYLHTIFFNLQGKRYSFSVGYLKDLHTNNFFSQQTPAAAKKINKRHKKKNFCEVKKIIFHFCSLSKRKSLNNIILQLFSISFPLPFILISAENRLAMNIHSHLQLHCLMHFSVSSLSLSRLIHADFLCK